MQIPEVPNLIKRTRLVRINFISSIPNYRFQNNCHWKELSLELIFCEFKTDWRISSISMNTDFSGLKHIFQDLRAQEIPSFIICKKCCIFTICDKKKRFIMQAAQGYIPEETLTRCSFADAIRGGFWSELSFKDCVPVVLLASCTEK